MKGFIDDIEEQAEANRDFRRVIYTGPRTQLVLMVLEPGEDIGEEIHGGTDQYFCVQEGKGTVLIEKRETRIDDDTAIFLPAGTRRNIKNTGKKPLKPYTLFAPPEHADGTVRGTKADAEEAEPIAVSR